MADGDDFESESEDQRIKDEYVDFESLKEKVGRFVRERDWEKYHNPKDIAIAISVEAGELLEIFQWMKEAEVNKIGENGQLMEKIEGELADILNYCMSLANVLDIDLARIIVAKLKEAERKYPKDKFKGTWKKPSD
jgi:NTP pyrophosphatase (non-canonical NTP hydrolase)